MASVASATPLPVPSFAEAVLARETRREACYGDLRVSRNQDKLDLVMKGGAA
jgi:hypothetical protein